MGIIEDQVKIDENSMIQTTQVLSAEVEKIEDTGKTAELLDLSVQIRVNPSQRGFVFSVISASPMAEII